MAIFVIFLMAGPAWLAWVAFVSSLVLPRAPGSDCQLTPGPVEDDIIQGSLET